MGYRFTSEQMLAMERHGISVFDSDEDAWEKQRTWSAEKKTACLKQVRLACQCQEQGPDFDLEWEFDAIEPIERAVSRLWGPGQGWKLRICPICHFPLIAKETADKIHDECKVPRRRDRQRRYISLKRAKAAANDSKL